MEDMSTLITQFCQCVDCYHSYDIKKFNVISWYNKRKMYKSLLKIKERISSIELFRLLLNDFFRNYKASEALIVLDNCTCVDTKDQYLFTIKGDKVTVTVSTRKNPMNDMINVSMRRDLDTYMHTFTYVNTFRSKKIETAKVGKECETILQNYIAMYLDARLSFNKER